MAISLESRYQEDRLARITEDGVTRTIIVKRPPGTNIFNFTYYQWAEGDRIDLLAHEYFDDERLWYVIADANPEILVWTGIPVGTVIRIPNG